MKTKYIFFILILIVFTSCMEKAPVETEGEGSIFLSTQMCDPVTKDTTILPFAKVFLISEYGMNIKQTDENGLLNLKNLPVTQYDIVVKGNKKEYSKVTFVGNYKDIDLNQNNMQQIEIVGNAVSATGIAINELYVSGPVNSIFYFYDQFIELYNSSDSVKYLDGMMILRVSGNRDGLGPGADEHGDNDIDGVVYAFKFPGKPGEKNYPFYPKTFKVLAQDAVDHTKNVEGSVNLRHADWEFVNQYDIGDIDIEDVPNLSSITPDRRFDFYISLISDIILLTDGTDTDVSDGVDIESILDGVEYQSSALARKTLDNRIDRGWIQSPPRYGGKSMERIEKGNDTNDGSIDWHIIDKPTPGK